MTGGKGSGTYTFASQAAAGLVNTDFDPSEDQLEFHVDPAQVANATIVVTQNAEEGRTEVHMPRVFNEGGDELLETLVYLANSPAVTADDIRLVN